MLERVALSPSWCCLSNRDSEGPHLASGATRASQLKGICPHMQEQRLSVLKWVLKPVWLKWTKILETAGKGGGGPEVGIGMGKMIGAAGEVRKGFLLFQSMRLKVVH